MDINTTFWFYDRIKTDNLCLLYNGIISDDITNKLIELSEFNISNVEGLSKMKKKASFLMAECFQNIIRHGEMITDLEKHHNNSFFLTRNWNDIYCIASGNLVVKKNIHNIENQMKTVNSLNKDELKELYLQVLEHNEISGKGGAGLGLIEMARKSGHKIQFVFEKFDESMSYFYNQILLHPDDSNKELSINHAPISDAISFHKKMQEESILVVQKGDFAQESILPVLKIVDNNLKSVFKNSSSKKKIFHIIVELLQNISKHGWKDQKISEGIILLGKSESNYTINTGNFIENDKVDALRERLQNLNDLSKDQLKDLYFSKLKERYIPEMKGAGIGLIDIARRITSPLVYNFTKIDARKSFVTIHIVA
ncbi:MAG: hypothetical protein A2X13_10920 [Bacteroidetes bacterium GWC2_33_15]|nr:MAG: hypothetical protein A2X10_11290 [Bacteroidetes bacterium GWA2_33_15]OFX52557.1 MAG: hypothetical protein A2X13_10920 [Bacteroidetes bacterium GWC2_33_15]OFX63902.1 MAG: hypothetical protein A2X15_03265 [Bacteroidetes bacterium GWB2_32_14]OFX70831.1 MAG: hypothetical protein A2X14_00325 [Bacteroidetes bacterium GWD2_33_33]HAN19959.1 hypothetical protein [Bacteroidales bacterium]